MEKENMQKMNLNKILKKIFQLCAIYFIIQKKCKPCSLCINPGTPQGTARAGCPPPAGRRGAVCPLWGSRARSGMGGLDRQTAEESPGFPEPHHGTRLALYLHGYCDAKKNTLTNTLKLVIQEKIQYNIHMHIYAYRRTYVHTDTNINQ